MTADPHPPRLLGTGRRRPRRRRSLASAAPARRRRPLRCSCRGCIRRSSPAATSRRTGAGGPRGARGVAPARAGPTRRWSRRSSPAPRSSASRRPTTPPRRWNRARRSDPRRRDAEEPLRHRLAARQPGERARRSRGQADRHGAGQPPRAPGALHAERRRHRRIEIVPDPVFRRSRCCRARSTACSAGRPTCPWPWPCRGSRA
jgi:hypothetical protein